MTQLTKHRIVNQSFVSSWEVSPNSITHTYYAQIQIQMNVCNRKYCDIFLWTRKDYFCQQVMQDKDIWKTYVEKAELVFRNGVFPEIIGKYLTRVPKVTVYDNNDESQFCYCKGGSRWRNIPLFSYRVSLNTFSFRMFEPQKSSEEKLGVS